ncbi:hypothetical protein MHU86_11590 [Fragilaria crotonensis]|nr:hypothetical protein MHU86_11590 [Fragilaria crotonensis]
MDKVIHFIFVVTVLLSYCCTGVAAFQLPNLRPCATSCVFGSNRKSSFVEEEAAMKELEEKGAGVVGATFFGGNKQKEELYDAVAEANANVELRTTINYNKWDDSNAFPDSIGQAVAKSIQGQLNGLLYTEESVPASLEYVYASKVEWDSPFSSSTGVGTTNPISELEKSLDFYNRLDVAITSGKTISPTQVELRWEISVVWPNFWEGRALLTGTSIVTLNDNRQIVKQVDLLDDQDLNGRLVPQVLPRFWDVYHLGMSPSAELSPRFPLKSPGILPSYKLYSLPPRLVYSPSLLDSGSREDAAAATVPNHAFCDFIKTMGPRRQRYVPTSPLEVVFSRQDNNKQRLIFSMPISVELQTNPTLPYPGDDPETPPDVEPLVEYKWQGARRVATMPYAGNPQDEQVVTVRKQLYEQVVVKDGLTPKLDPAGRPQFFFWSNNVKNCYTETGLGMAVYEYRGKWAKSNEVGIELEVAGTDLVKKQ